MKILIIRRDNIGDLVCTTPLIRALRTKLPDAYIAAYVNSYSAPVLEGNPDLDAVYFYTKAKHTANPVAALRAYWQRARLMLQLYREQFDDVLIAEGYSLKLMRQARWLARKRVIGFAAPTAQRLNPDVVISPSTQPEHEVQTIYRLAAAYGVVGDPPATRVIASNPFFTSLNVPIIGLHISARKPSQRWPAERFIALAQALHQQGARLRLFWAPGNEQDPLHPGDDAKAQQIMHALPDCAMAPVPTHTLRALIDGLAECDVVICADGGAMHLAAGLGKPIVCLFGQSDAVRWAPWGVPYQLLQAPSREVCDVSVGEVLAAYARLPVSGSLGRALTVMQG